MLLLNHFKTLLCQSILLFQQNFIKLKASKLNEMTWQNWRKICSCTGNVLSLHFINDGNNGEQEFGCISPHKNLCIFWEMCGFLLDDNAGAFDDSTGFGFLSLGFLLDNNAGAFDDSADIPVDGLHALDELFALEDYGTFDPAAADCMGSIICHHWFWCTRCSLALQKTFVKKWKRHCGTL
jgi:hypothetical protein